MKKMPRPLLYLILVSASAVLVWFVEKPAEEKTGDILNQSFLPRFQPKEVAAIRIEHLMHGVRLKKENGEWQGTDIKTRLRETLEEDKKGPKDLPEKWGVVDPNRVTIALEALQNLRAVSLAGNNPERHGYFEVNEVGMQIWLYDANGTELAHLHLGKMGPGFGEGYARKEGESPVYLTDKFLRPLFPTDAGRWKPAEGAGRYQ